MHDCFVIMPFSKTTDQHDERYWTEFFEGFLRPALEKCGYKARRSEDTPGNITARIVGDVVTCELVLAVLTDSKHNVFYELGVRHASRHGTVMVLEKGHKPAFDVAGHGIIFYERQKLPEFERKLNEHVQGLANTGSDNPVSDALNMGLVYALNTSRGRLREALALLHEPGVLPDPAGACARMRETAGSWPEVEQISIVDSRDKIVYHKEKTLVGQDAKQRWHDAGRGGEPLFPHMRDTRTGLIVYQAVRRKGRLTAMAYDTLKNEWMVIAEAHYFHGGERLY